MKKVITTVLVLITITSTQAHYIEHDYNFKKWNSYTYSTRNKSMDNFQTRGFEMKAIHETKAVWMPLVEEEYDFNKQDF